MRRAGAAAARTARTRRSRLVVAASLAVLILVLLGPALAPGYTLIRDQVFVPDQSLLPWMLGIGAGLPRSVPQDAVVAVLSGPVPGWVLEKLAMVGALSLLGAGVARLLRGSGTGARSWASSQPCGPRSSSSGCSWATGPCCWPSGPCPWLLDVARRARSGERRTWAPWFLLLSLASLTVSGGVLALAVSLPVAVGPRSRLSGARRAGWAVTGVVAQLPWLVPTLVVSSARPGSGRPAPRCSACVAESWPGCPASPR